MSFIVFINEERRKINGFEATKWTGNDSLALVILKKAREC